MIYQSFLFGCNIIMVTFSLLLAAALVADAFKTPKPYSQSRYIRYWNNSPFEKEVKPVAPKPIEKIKVAPHNFTLAGALRKGSRDVVYIQDTQTKQVYKTISDQENAQGLKLMNLELEEGGFNYKATVLHNGSIISLNYDRQKLTESTRSIPPPKPVRENSQQATPVAPQNGLEKPAKGSSSKAPAPTKKPPRKRTIFSPK